MAGRFVRASNFRHVFADQPKLDKCISNVKLTRSAWDSNFLAANSKYLAICWHSGGGGTFAITDQKFVGKLDSDQPVCTSHSGAVLDLAFHPFNDNIIASSSEDCTAKIWSIPDGGLKENLTESVVTLRGHQIRLAASTSTPALPTFLPHRRLMRPCACGTLRLHKRRSSLKVTRT